jgi:hypothetical protein
MIDWLNLVGNSLWIFSLALALATFSYASWQASINHDKSVRNKFRLELSSPTIQISLNISGMLLCAGLAATSAKIYEIVLWIILAIAFGIWAILGGIQQKRLENYKDLVVSKETDQF